MERIIENIDVEWGCYSDDVERERERERCK